MILHLDSSHFRIMNRCPSTTLNHMYILGQCINHIAISRSLDGAAGWCKLLTRSRDYLVRRKVSRLKLELNRRVGILKAEASTHRRVLDFFCIFLNRLDYRAFDLLSHYLFF